MSTVDVRWMNEGRSKVTHGFLTIDLSAGFERVAPIGPCGRFTVADLHEDETADRCAGCQRALPRLFR